MNEMQTIVGIQGEMGVITGPEMLPSSVSWASLDEASGMDHTH